MLIFFTFMSNILTLPSMEKIGSVLVVDDDQGVLRSLELLLDDEFESVHTVANPNLIPESLAQQRPDVILLDMNFSAGRHSGNEGLYWLREIRNRDEDVMVVMFTAYADIDLAVKAMKEGAMDFVVKPWNNERLMATLKTAVQLKKSQHQVKDLSRQKEGLSAELNKQSFDIIGESPAIQEVMRVVEKVGPTEANVLISGENGTGKELIAREIHNRSGRSGAPMITVDLTTVNESLFESELFGHVKGAFTDARSDRTGRLEVAGGGTLFLDEIGNLPYHMQAKLLTVLQNRQVTPVGSNQPRAIDIRLVCATNKDMNRLIGEGHFRDDLFYRINTIHIEVPPLRERGEDVVLLARYYLDHYSSKYGKDGLGFTAEALDKLRNYHWPGNVRELRHAVEKAVILTEASSIGPGDFFFHSETSAGNKEDWPLRFEEIEKRAIIRALANNEGKLIGAARELGITRQTLYNKLKKYQIDPSGKTDSP
jgi:DNA-binding NtrC family response regulator